MLEADRLDGRPLAAAVRELLAFRPEPVALDLDGARKTALLVGNLAARATAPAPDPCRRLVGVNP